MHSPDDRSADVRWFIETLLVLREELSADQFECLREWLEFVAGRQSVVH